MPDRSWMSGLPVTLRALFWLFGVFLVGQFWQLDQPLFALLAALLTVLSAYSLDRACRFRCELSGGELPVARLAQRVASCWRCGPLVLLTLRQEDQRRGRGCVPACLSRRTVKLVWVTGEFDERGRKLLRELRLSKRAH